MASLITFRAWRPLGSRIVQPWASRVCRYLSSSAEVPPCQASEGAQWRAASSPPSSSARPSAVSSGNRVSQQRRAASGAAAVRGKCIGCGEDQAGWTFICKLCGKPVALRKPSAKTNFFEIFGSKAAFDINSKELDSAYKRMQMQTHPDKFSRATNEERQLAESHSAFITDAYRVLKDPIARAKHFMEAVHGESPYCGGAAGEETEGDEEDFGSWGHGAPGRVQNQELLMDILEINDEIDEATKLDEIHVIKKRCQATTNEALTALGQALARSDWATAREQLEILQMYSRVNHRLTTWEFGDVHREMASGHS